MKDNDIKYIVRVTNPLSRMDQTVKNHGVKNAYIHQNYTMIKNQIEYQTLENYFANNNWK